MREVLRRGIREGELRADIDIDVVLAMLGGPLVAQSLVRWMPDLDRADLADRLVAAIWPAIAAR
jgi:Tetracyclin repressor-like, C-terminal domain